MAMVSAEYQKYVLDDLKTYMGLYCPVRASLLERMIVRSVSPKNLHPNPEDEFSMPSIGPNYEIIGRYEKACRNAVSRGGESIGEALEVAKMSTGGYMLLNGHHRWMAAIRTGIKKVPVHITNIVTNEEIINTVNRSKNEMCISFDLDEVLLTDGTKYPAARDLKFPLDRIFEKTLRKNAPSLITSLQEKGFDVWVYTGSYYSTQYLEYLFKLHHIKPDGIINALNGKRKSDTMRNTFSKKYGLSVHADNEVLTFVNTRTKAYDILDLDGDDSAWAASVNAAVAEFLSRYTESGAS